jgi:DNA-binding PadR family transcriptional regulator
VPGTPALTRPFRDVTQALLDATGELHGWAIAQKTGHPTATVYRILARLTVLGWATSRPAASTPGTNRPARKLFTLTADGVIHLFALTTRPARTQPSPPRV